MSAYFQRLVQQTGLRIQLLATHDSVASLPASGSTSVPAFAPPHSVDVTEAYEERIAETSPARPVDSRAIPPATIPDTSKTQPIAEQRSKAPQPSIEQEIVFSPPAPARATDTPAAHVAEPASPLLTPEPANSNDLPAPVLQSVLKWIAAGQTSAPKANSPETDSPVEDRREPKPTPSSLPPAEFSPSPSPAPTPPAAAIPARVIEILEENIVSPPPSPRPAIAPSRTVPAPAPPAPAATASAATAQPSANDGVRVSIGAIHLRVETPAPAPVRTARSSEPAARTAPAPARSSGSSRLRRHYILPH